MVYRKQGKLLRSNCYLQQGKKKEEEEEKEDEKKVYRNRDPKDREKKAQVAVAIHEQKAVCHLANQETMFQSQNL